MYCNLQGRIFIIIYTHFPSFIPYFLYSQGTELQPSMHPFWTHLQMAQEQSGDVEGARETAAHLVRLRREEQQH